MTGASWRNALFAVTGVLVLAAVGAVAYHYASTASSNRGPAPTGSVPTTAHPARSSGGSGASGGSGTAPNTPPSTVPASTAPPTTAAPQLPTLLRPFVGAWNAHGASVTIDASGAGTATWRTYNWCSSGAPPPCDSTNGNMIVGGGAATFTITSVAPAGVAHATATSNEPSEIANGPIDLTLTGTDELVITPAGSSSATLTLCGPSAPAGTCGA